ncbi:MAG TPA: hypothetical protein DCX25_02760 [Candidatus Pacebacteria bacterium]|nr:MAG: hypothetical protein UX00_C0004G0025 [Microgenomates group bacterium GW2011_GWB1_45_17]KKU23977.1 MAG: hypothetical protein UX35_C0003G0113 [Microgenomates group bacterium GW2011_GWA1_46_15]KKU24630.1 MAG: hypothetical protein UX36_C0001G0247 [Microgenomates group bacterium GW2011_GWC1_46_15]HAV15225.1 hypothetical protein [Candidatus Paceibacterota bacterium]HCR10940.1 hypothetical protein [Candidatus Paceibacterota bacterium]
MTLMIMLVLLAWFVGFPSQVTAMFVPSETIRNNTLSFDDWTPPKTHIAYQYVSNNPTPFQELIVNGDFVDGTQGWDIHGEVETKDHLVQIGSEHSILAEHSSVAQLIPNTAKTLTFTYQIFTTEQSAGFDDPAFEVRINDKQVFQIRAEDIHNGSTEVQTVRIDLTQFSEDHLLITFSAGNTGDNENPSWVEFSHVTTIPILANPSTQLTFLIDDLQQSISFIQYSSFTQPIPVAPPFTLTQNPENNTLTFWSEDFSQNKEESLHIPASFNNVAPQPIRFLSTMNAGNGEYVLEFTTPSDDFGNISKYELYASPTPITHETNLSTLTRVEQTQESFHSPLIPEAEETLFINNFDPNTQYYFAIISQDAFGNHSDIQEEG